MKKTRNTMLAMLYMLYVIHKEGGGGRGRLLGTREYACSL